MKEPTTLRIGNVTYALVPLEPHEEGEFFGRSQLSKHFIKLSKTLTGEYRRVILWHEIVHQIIDQGMLDDKLHDERIVQLLANGIYQALRDNKFLRDA